MEVTVTAIVKVTKFNGGPFEHAESLFKWPKQFVNIDNIVYYLTHLPDIVPRGLEVDLKGSSTSPILAILMYIERLNLFSHL